MLASELTRPLDRAQLDELISLHDRVLLGVLPRALPMSDELAQSLILPKEFVERRPAPSVPVVREQDLFRLGPFSTAPRIPIEQRLELALTLPARQREKELLAINRDIYKAIGDASVRVDLAEFFENTAIHRAVEVVDLFTNPFAGFEHVGTTAPRTIAERSDRWKRSVSDFNLKYVGDLTEQASTAIIYDRHAEGVSKLVEALQRIRAVTDIASRYESASERTEQRAIFTAVNVLMLGGAVAEVAFATRAGRIELQGAQRARDAAWAARSPIGQPVGSAAVIRSGGTANPGALLASAQSREQLLAQYPGLRARLAPELPSPSAIRPPAFQPGSRPTISARRFDFGHESGLSGSASAPSRPPGGAASVVATERGALQGAMRPSFSSAAPGAATPGRGTTSAYLRQRQASIPAEGTLGAESLESTTVSVIERVPQPRTESLTTTTAGGRGRGFERAGTGSVTSEPVPQSGRQGTIREFDFTDRPAAFSPKPDGVDYTSRVTMVSFPVRENGLGFQPNQFPEFPAVGIPASDAVREIVTESPRIGEEEYREEFKPFVERPNEPYVEPAIVPHFEIENPSEAIFHSRPEAIIIAPLRPELLPHDAARTSLPLQRQSEILDRALAGDFFLAEIEREELKRAVADLLGRSASSYEVEREMQELGLGSETIRELLSLPKEQTQPNGPAVAPWKLPTLVASAEVGQPALTPRQEEVKQELVKILTQIETLEADPATAQEAYDYSHRVKEGYFWSSETPVGALPIAEALKFVARATRSPAVQETWGASAVSALVYEMSYSKCVDQVVTSIQGSEVPEQLDVLHQLQTIAADAIGNGGWARPAVRQIEEIVEQVEAQAKVPIVSYLCQSIADRILAERQDPSLGVIKRVGDQRDSRLSQSLSEELAALSERLGRQLVRSDGQAIVGRLVPLASDSVVLLDHSGLPHSFAAVDFSQLPSPAKIDPRALDAVRQRLEGEVPLGRMLGSVLDARFFLAVEAGVEESHPTARRDLLRELPSLSEAEASTLLDAIATLERVSMERGLAKQRAFEAAAKECQDLSKACMETSRAALARYVEQHPEYASIKSELDRQLADLEQHGLLDEQFDLIEQIGFRSIPQLSATVRASFDRLRAAHSETWANSRRVADNSQEVANWDRDSEIAMRQLNELEPKMELVRSDLIRLVERLQHSTNSTLLPVSLRPFSEIGTDPVLNPFQHEHPDQVALLLKHLGNPELRNRIELDLGVSRSSIPIRPLIHFLRYLEQQDPEGFARLRVVLQEHPTLSNKILRAFVAHAENPKFCKAIFQVAELEEPLADAILSKYLELAEVGEREIAGMVTQLNPEHPIQVERRALVEVMRRANRLLEQFGNTGATLDADTLLARLDDTRKEVVVLAMSFKTVSRRAEIALGEIAGMNLACTRPTELSPELVAEMRRIYADSCYKDYPRALADELTEYFEKSLQKPDARFYTLEFEGKLLAFVRAVPQDDGSVHIGAFNSCSDAMNSQIAPALFRHMLRIEGPQAELRGEVVKTKVGFLMPTYEALGWSRGEEIVWGKTGVEVLEIRRPRGPLAPRGAPTTSSSTGVE